MSLKVKCIILAIVGFIVAVTIASVSLYIRGLNNKIDKLENTVAEQKQEIKSLNCQIEVLEKDLKSVQSTIKVTNDYINTLEKTQKDEINKKQEIYKKITEDPAVGDWYNESIPQTLIETIAQETDFLCIT